MKPSNPIEGELAKLEEQWETFIDSEQPILRWLIPPDSYQIARAFVKVKEQFEDDNPDLFIGLASVFADPGRFAFALADELNRSTTSTRRSSITYRGWCRTWRSWVRTRST
jgi:hypothetical protein